MSNPVIGKLLPSQRQRLARAHFDIAAIYRDALAVHYEPALESAARVNDLIGNAFASATAEPVQWTEERK